jgi:2-iminobutanoate/2-iminopropanoate deaminase
LIEKEVFFMKKPIVTEKAPGAIGPYSQGIQVGEFVYTSGQLPLDPVTKEMPESIQEQTRIALENVKAVLEEAGLNLSDVVKTTVFLDDITEFSLMNEVYATFFTAPFPARSAFEVANLPLAAKVEIEVVAVNNNPKMKKL